MSAVLSAPAMNPFFKTLDPEFKSSLRELMITLVKEDQEFREILAAIIEECNVKSETPNRLAVIETIMGIADFRGISALNGKEEDPTFPEQFSLLAKRIDNLTEPIQETVIEPRTSLEFKATEFAIHVRDVVIKKGKTFLKSNEIMDFMKSGLSTPYRMKDIKNPRQFKKDVIQKASKMFPFIVLDKKKNGRRDVRIRYKPENDTSQLKRTDAYIRSETT